MLSIRVVIQLAGLYIVTKNPKQQITPRKIRIGNDDTTGEEKVATDEVQNEKVTADDIQNGKIENDKKQGK